MRLIFVVQRYGAGVAGGAEALCRNTAQALSAHGHEVLVLTTTARDHPDWDAFYPLGESLDRDVQVMRFAARTPDVTRAVRLARRLALEPGDAERERAWVHAQGPVTPGLLAELERRGPSADAVVFWSYLYATTQLGLPLATGRAVLVPLGHEEPMLRFGVTRAVVAAANALAFLTGEERRLIDDLHGLADRPNRVVGTGLHPAVAGEAGAARSRFGLPSRFALYLGRVDAAKGVDLLVQQHGAYRRRGGALGLVVAGRGSLRDKLPAWVATTGFVSAQERADLLAAAEVVVLPSPYESLSLAALEAWQSGTPTLANARCEVVAGQTARSRGGLLYSESTYAAQLDRLAEDGSLRARLGREAAAWVEPQTWEACAARWDELLTELTRAGG